MTTINDVIYALGYANGHMDDHKRRGHSEARAVRCAALALADKLNIHLHLIENNKE